MFNKNVVITGMGLLSPAGNTVDEHYKLFNINTPLGLDNTSYEPFCIHQIGAVDWHEQIAKKSDLRQISIWQKLGVYAAGKALEDANIKYNKDILEYVDVIVASGGGERDIIADEAIFKATELVIDKNQQDAVLNEALQQELRPTLFLAQLSNLLAGNIAIIHKTFGRSVTVMGEDAASATCVEQAKLMIETGQSKVVLVGASFFSNTIDMLLNFNLANLLERKMWRPMEDRVSKESSLVLGNGAAFLVLEEEQHAIARQAKIYGSLKSFALEMFDREHIKYKQNLFSFYQNNGINNNTPVITAVSGERISTAIEMSILSSLEVSYKSFSDKIGYMKEAQFLFALAIAALSLNKNKFIYTSMVGINNSEAIACLHRYAYD